MAEKKSTAKAKSVPGKRVAKKLEETKPASEVQPTVEQVKPREINWDVIGFSSAAVTLVGASILYLSGYSYITGWYTYFGLLPFQVKVPIDFVIVQSALPVLATMTFFIFTTILIDLNKRLSMIASTLLFVSGATLFLLTQNEKEIILNTEGITMMTMGIIMFLGNIVLEKDFGKREWGSKLIYLSVSFVVIAGLVMSMGTALGQLEGRYGLNPFGFSYELKQFMLVSSQPLYPLQGTELDKISNADRSYAYGPFTIIAQDEYSLFLVRQPISSESNVQESNLIDSKSNKKPDLYIVPRNGNTDIFLIPVPSIQSSHQSSQVPILTPTNTANYATSTETPKITSTSTPISTKP